MANKLFTIYVPPPHCEVITTDCLLPEETVLGYIFPLGIINFCCSYKVVEILTDKSEIWVENFHEYI